MYTSISIHNFEPWYQSFRENVHEARINLDRDAEKVSIAPSVTSSYRVIPENGFLVKLHHTGGTIVGFPGSITLLAFTRPETAPTWKEDLAAFLVGKGLNARVDKNDVMVDEYKVAGYMDRKYGDTYHYYAIHISINCDAELVRQIVTRPIRKTPKGLSEYNITREEVLAALGVETGGDASE